MRDSCGTDIAFTDEQKKCIDYDSKTALVIKGTAGSGKSLMVVKRAMEYRDEILRSGTGEKVCIMTYTKTLTQGISDLIRINDSKGKEGDSGADICGDESDSYRDNCLAVANVDRYLTEICKRLGLFPKESNNYNQKNNYNRQERYYGYKRMSNDDRISVMSEVLKELSQESDHPYYRRDPQFWVDEVLWMYRNGIVDDDDKNQYLSIRREGRCKKYNVNLNKNGREIAFKIFVGYNRILVKKGFVEYDRIYALLYRDYSDKIPSSYKFDYLLLDEAQDFTLIKMKLLRLLYRKELTIAMDKNQNIYGCRWSFKSDLNLNVHVKKLTVMFRGTKQIDDFSMDLKKVDDTLLDHEDRYCNETSPIDRGVLPKIVCCHDSASELEFIAREVKALSSAIKTASIAILCPNWINLNQFKIKLRNSGVIVEFFRDEDFDPFTPGVKLITTYSAKGLGFAIVFIPYVTEGVYPKSAENIINSIIESQQSSSESIDYDDAIEEEVSDSRRLLYVGITRAMADIYLTYSGAPSRFINEFDPTHYRLINEAHEDVSDSRIKPHPVSKTEVMFADEQSEAEGTSDIIDILNDNGIEYIDRRPMSGVLWIVDSGPDVKVLIESLTSKGYKFSHTDRGSRATHHRPAYYYEG